ncbi:MAG: hydantoinase/oxoprolinase family protein, partial [Alphaproteobacteria bacterium]|nr:hydantoinase/oxoprolinase family protein [Alphaproteobacteria bacterium]
HGALLAAFNKAYRRRYGRNEDMPVEILTWRLAVEGPRSALGETLLRRQSAEAFSSTPTGHRPAWFGTEFQETPIYRRANLGPDTEIKGPAIIEEVESTTIVPPEFDLTIDRALNLVLRRTRK